MTTTSNLNFRLAKVDDVDKIVTLINEAFRDDNTTQVFLDADHARVDVADTATMKAGIAQPDRKVFVATDSTGDIVGHCSVRQLPDNVGWLGLLAVNVHSKNRGLGSQVLKHAENYARRELGDKRMEFDVVCTRAELIAWYTNRGYTPTGKTTPFPYDHHKDWQGVLRDDLYFVTFGKDLTAEA
ncbi:putative gcn5-related n-acetyltransferase protein [Phaeoacremonium minimum UCRPA7]|uniref:Putative gcn5-related n-acetyltransferase protein n=1 Tax=Phaeoacremonium minimum (strain UCR-PA7) TaxID=1286976 RepID=R8BEF0_PHAM7|nr:putative gcn5-related n-acetyltransferase protein [Phaeoacremonium minimum UCRPA7]EON97660.1 putative gcn5-related n-acetyltransferase protein [Phaeoacremonium minimum UCRPA7]